MTPKVPPPPPLITAFNLHPEALQAGACCGAAVGFPHCAEVSTPPLTRLNTLSKIMTLLLQIFKVSWDAVSHRQLFLMSGLEK